MQALCGGYRRLSHMCWTDTLALPKASARSAPVAHRHGLNRVNADRLTMEAVRALIAGQAVADRDAAVTRDGSPFPRDGSTLAPAPGTRPAARPTAQLTPSPAAYSLYFIAIQSSSTRLCANEH